MIIRVTNGNDFAFTDRYDGIPYEFPIGESVKLPIEAAPIPDFRHTARRYGWDTPPASRNKDERPDFAAQLVTAQRWFDKLKIEARRQVVTDEALDEHTLPAPRIGAAEAVNDADPPPPPPRRTVRRQTMSPQRRKQLLANLEKGRATKRARLDAAAALLPQPETAGDLAGGEPVAPPVTGDSWPVIRGEEAV